MSASTIDLTEPARSLFAQTGPLLEEWLPQILPPNTSWCIGGGTILAAQWRHRVSTDIDIFLPARAGIAALSPAWDGRFVDEMAALGATHVEVQNKSLKFSFPLGRVEISALDPTPPLSPLFVQVDEREVHVLPNACILAGKMAGRGLGMPARDVFDICVAADLDPASLRCAVNQMPAQMRSEVAAYLMAGEHNYLEDAPSKILVPAAQWECLLSDGPRKVVEIMEGFAYREVDLSYSAGSAAVLVETNRGEVFSKHFQDPQDLLTGLFGLGLEEWVLANNGTIEAFLTTAASCLQSSRNVGGGDGCGGGMAGC